MKFQQAFDAHLYEEELIAEVEERLEGLPEAEVAEIMEEAAEAAAESGNEVIVREVEEVVEEVEENFEEGSAEDEVN